MNLPTIYSKVKIVGLLVDFMVKNVGLLWNLSYDSCGVKNVVWVKELLNS
jgi:hypothetical protein